MPYREAIRSRHEPDMPGPSSLFNHRRYPAGTQQALLLIGVSGLRPWISLLLACLLVSACADNGRTTLAIAWWCLALASTLAGMAYRRHWQRRLSRPQPPEVLRRGEYWGIAYALLLAILWGSISQFMQPEDDANLLLAMTYFGVCAASASLSALGMANISAGALLAFILFSLPMPRIYPTHWSWFVVMLAFYHLVLLIGVRQRLDMMARNLELTRSQEDLLLAQRQETARANRANQDKSAFLAAASHDLRQPVHAIMLLGHALQMRPQDDASRQLVTQILSAGKALSDQFNSLMELSRLESGKYAPSRQTLPLRDFLERKREGFREVAASRGMSLRVRPDRRLARAQLSTDLSLLNRIIDNLLDNALKFSPAGGRVLLTARRRQGRLCLAVLDQGSGIPAEARERIFLPHVQLDNPARDRARGIGLGLSIVKEAAQLLGAELRLNSRPGRGSGFLLTLPADMLELPDRPETTPAPHAPAKPVRSADLHDLRLLIVEDDPMVAHALRHWATSWGMRVSHHAHPGEVDSLRDVDLVICDIRLPDDRDGIDWLSQWLAAWPDTAGLLVSGEAGEAVQERAEQEGLLLLAKPVDPDLLLRTLLRLKR